MACKVTEEDWNEFVEVVTSSIKGHQEPSFIDTVALALKDGVYNDYQVGNRYKDEFIENQRLTVYFDSKFKMYYKLLFYTGLEMVGSRIS